MFTRIFKASVMHSSTCRGITLRGILLHLLNITYSEVSMTKNLKILEKQMWNKRPGTLLLYQIWTLFDLISFIKISLKTNAIHNEYRLPMWLYFLPDINNSKNSIRENPGINIIVDKSQNWQCWIKSFLPKKKIQPICIKLKHIWANLNSIKVLVLYLATDRQK